MRSITLLLLLQCSSGFAPGAPARTYLEGLSTRPRAPTTDAVAREERAAEYLGGLSTVPSRAPRAAAVLREKRAREDLTGAYLDGLDRRQWLTTAFARERGDELARREAERRREGLAATLVVLPLVEEATPLIVPAVDAVAAVAAIELVAIADDAAYAVGEVLDGSAAAAALVVDVDEETSALAWKGVMLFVTIAWATNFAITAYVCADIAASTGLGASQAAAVFVVLRFATAALSTLPWLISSSSKEAALASAKVGALYAIGYGAQAAALAHGFPAANAAFVCSLQCVAVALLGKGSPPPTTIAGLLLAISGVACLELLGANGGDFDPAGLALALGQPLAFGASYVELEKATRDHPDDALAMTALQCLAILGAGVGALAAMEGADGALSDVLTTWQHLDAPLAASVAWTGVVSTSFTIWLCTQAFRRLSSVDASLILTSEPLWAAVVAAALLGERFSAGDALGGLLILLAVAVNDELIRVPGRMCIGPSCDVDYDEP